METNQSSTANEGMTMPDLARQYLRNAGEKPHFMVGPAVYQPEHASYFVLLASDDTRPDGLSVQTISGGDRETTDKARAALLAALIGEAQTPVITHDFGDEAEMAHWAAAAFPCKRTRQILADLQAEQEQDAEAVAPSTLRRRAREQPVDLAGATT